MASSTPVWDGAAQLTTNFQKTFFDYYTKVAGIALYSSLIVIVRAAPNRSTSVTAQAAVVGTRQASYYLQGRGYTEEDVERAVSAAGRGHA